MTDTDRIDELVRTCARIEAKVDKLDEKLDGHAETLARHDMRLTELEKRAQRQWERFALWAGVIGGLAAAIIPNLIH